MSHMDDYRQTGATPGFRASRAYLTTGRRDVKMGVLSGCTGDLSLPLRGVAGSGKRTGWGKTIGKDAVGRNPSHKDLGLGARCSQADANSVFADLWLGYPLPSGLKGKSVGHGGGKGPAAWGAGKSALWQL